MIKNVKKLGKTLTKAEQKTLKGGAGVAGMRCNTNRDCWDASPFLGPGDVSCGYNFFSPYRVCVYN